MVHIKKKRKKERKKDRQTTYRESGSQVATAGLLEQQGSRVPGQARRVCPFSC